MRLIKLRGQGTNHSCSTKLSACDSENQPLHGSSVFEIKAFGDVEAFIHFKCIYC